MTQDSDTAGDGTEHDWWAEKNQVIRRKKDGELYHVLGRMVDVDTGEMKYEIHDDTHTTREYWHHEDIRECFKKEAVMVLHHRKPLQVLDGRLYEPDKSLLDDADRR